MAKLNAKLTDNIKDRLKFLKNNPYIQILISKKNWFIFFFLKHIYDDETFIIKKYKKAFGCEPDIKSPKTFNEKLQWLKLYYRDPLMAICADKLEVRGYLSEKGFGNLLNTVYAVYQNVNDVDFDQLPDRFIMKANHGSGWNIFCEDKSIFAWSGWSKVMDCWLKQNSYIYGREWVYRDMKPRILCEKYLEVSNGELFDYKFFCLNGRVEFIQVTDNDKKTARINLYDKKWNLMKEKYAFIGSPKNIPKPARFERMLEIAGELSKPFPFARVDLYDVDGEIVFGEITFFPSSGFKGFDPKEYDLELGKRLVLPQQEYSNIGM